LTKNGIQAVTEINRPAGNGYSFLFVVNPIAGGKDKGSWTETIENHLKDQPHTTSFFETTGEQDPERLAQCIEAQRPDRLIAIGGDGTFRMVAELAAKKKLPVGFLPAGSANGMARELNLPTDIHEALQIILGDTITKIDALRVNGHLSLHMSDVGLNAQLIEYFEQSPGRGWWGYAREVIKTLRQGRVVSAKIWLDKKLIRKRAAMIILANGRTYGTGVVVNENGRLTDGQFEVIILRQVTLWRIFCSLLSRKATSGTDQKVYRGKQLELKLPVRMPFQVDGEFIGHTRTLNATVLPNYVSVLTRSKVAAVD
jgi:diacylglycerol kinase family enzyme